MKAKILSIGIVVTEKKFWFGKNNTNSNKFALLLGEAQLCLPYVCF